jgi:hypothetical protein
MAKDTKSREATPVSGLVTKPLGKAKAARFAAVEELKKGAAANALSERLSGRGLKGDAYRKEIAKAFKKT